jgi:two-component system cell cycle response regulator CtrA
VRVLLVADAATRRLVTSWLEPEGVKLIATSEGEEAIDLAKTYGYDAILLDDSLADAAVLVVLRTMRAAGVKTPVIVTTAGGHGARTAALNAGADDSLTTPASLGEMLARLHAVIRRSNGQAAPVIRVGSVAIDLARRVVDVDGKTLNLTSTEYRIMAALALKPGTTFTKDRLLDQLYGGRDEPADRIIDVYICKVRRKLREAGVRDVIQTVWGRGYRLQAPAPMVGAEAA